ncbi:hypothetical protein EJ03DRAFT_158931 [Teratosphaeria nubilosa]|uniref:Uncharacterized protein n=1 Tax=Teratosphaeria nubilosa TaxID=161662 RepID=A0A6G1L2U9_9PEZI|nr:hypothetical protein EJ03DRAFT_158931 [Teratosphaeria nubilosa]
MTIVGHSRNLDPATACTYNSFASSPSTTFPPFPDGTAADFIPRSSCIFFFSCIASYAGSCVGALAIWSGAVGAIAALSGSRSWPGCSGLRVAGRAGGWQLQLDCVGAAGGGELVGCVELYGSVDVLSVGGLERRVSIEDAWLWFVGR